MKPVLHAENLCFRFGDEPLLDGVTFSVYPRDFVAVIGPNGAGKSTLLKLVLGELPAKDGRVALFGEDLARFRAWPRIGYVPQTAAVSGGRFPATAEEIVCANLYPEIGPFRPVLKQHRERSLQALALVGMRDFAKRMLSELSGGQLQRVMLARALVCGCELLLLDEPATGVDARSADNLYSLLCKLQGEGLTVLMVTHDTERAARYVSRTLCIENGSMVEILPDQLAHELDHKHKHL